MPVYAYKGLTSEGKSVAGVIDAESPRGARLHLRRSGIFPTDLAEERVESTLTVRLLDRFVERVSSAELALMTRQLSGLVGAGLPLVECLSALIEQSEQRTLKRILSHVRQRVREGQSFANALRTHPHVFSEIYVNMVRAGEASGALETVLARLADYTEAQARLVSKIRGALTYPLLMVAVASAILFFLLAYVVPQVTRIFAETGQGLPLPTTILLTLSGFVASGWWALLLLFAGALLLGNRALRTPRGRALYDRYMLRLPWIGPLLKKIAMARFSRTLSTLLHSGVPLLTALEIVKHVVTNGLIRQVIEEARKSVEEGEPLAPPLQRSGIFPPLLLHMVAVGEKSGHLEEMLAKAADTYDHEVETSVTTLTTLLEPLTILFMGAVVLFIVLAILMPIFQLNTLIR